MHARVLILFTFSTDMLNIWLKLCLLSHEYLTSCQIFIISRCILGQQPRYENIIRLFFCSLRQKKSIRKVKCVEIIFLRIWPTQIQLGRRFIKEDLLLPFSYTVTIRPVILLPESTEANRSLDAAVWILFQSCNSIFLFFRPTKPPHHQSQGSQRPPASSTPPPPLVSRLCVFQSAIVI